MASENKAPQLGLSLYLANAGLGLTINRQQCGIHRQSR